MYETHYEPTDADLLAYKESCKNSPILRCDICKSPNLNILGDCCLSCGASISDPFNEYIEEASF